jgi:cytosine/uracil/thiamine/allantoin permease
MVQLEVQIGKYEGLTCERIRSTFFFFHLKNIFVLVFDSYYTHTMDEWRCKILVVLVFIMAMHWVIAQVGHSNEYLLHNIRIWWMHC